MLRRDLEVGLLIIEVVVEARAGGESLFEGSVFHIYLVLDFMSPLIHRYSQFRLAGLLAQNMLMSPPWLEFILFFGSLLVRPTRNSPV